jgi:hypothetical protein
MARILYFLFLLLFVFFEAKSQISPKESSLLHYRIIGFSFPEIKDVSKYTIEIADGTYYTENQFKINIVKTFSGNTNKLIGEVPYFDRSYTWRVVYQNSNSIAATDLFHFKTMANDVVDQCAYRLRIITPAAKYQNAYVFLDSHSALYDMNGQPVWFLPVRDKKKGIPRDLKATSFGTITYMMGGNIYEVNYDGEIIWQGPENSNVNEKTQRYHHEFSRLWNGNYMVLGNESMWAKKSASDNSISFIPESKITADTSDPTYRKVLFGTITEYDKNGKEVWSWSSSGFYNSPDMQYNGAMEDIMNTHENAFYFDEPNKKLYVSFKGTSNILKISYPDGKVLSSYGLTSIKGHARNISTFFCDQHSCMISKKGYLYLYNNNVCNPSQHSKIVVLQEPTSPGDTMKPVWEYDCTIERTADNMDTQYKFTSGGNVIELPDQSIFAYMGATYSKVFIVGLDKKIVWSALPEKWMNTELKWRVIPNYRASIIPDRESLEKLIWNAKK